MFAGQAEGQRIDPKGSPMISGTPSSLDGSDEPVWEAPRPHRVWSRGQTLAAVGVAAVIAAFGGAAIYCATSASNEMGPGMQGSGVHAPAGGTGLQAWEMPALVPMARAEGLLHSMASSSWPTTTAATPPC
jgi:hypothetical protein